MTDPTIKVLLADDHHIVLEGLIEIFRTMPNVQVAGIAHNGKELLEQARRKEADLVIMDINMPELDGLKCTVQLKKEFPGMKVLILTMYNDRIYINEMINSGVDGCILKSKGTAELRDAISRVMQDKSYFDSLPDFKADTTGGTNMKLSDREIEVIKLVVKGKSSSEIADALFISEHTVKTHRKNIFKKLQINHLSQLTTIAINRGWG